MAFADNLRTFRKQNNLTQEELAQKLNVSQKAVSAWEVGRSDPTMGDVIKLCKIFDCPIEELTETRTRNVGEITIEDIYAKINTLSIDDMRNIQIAVNHKMNELEEAEMIKHEKAVLEKEILNMQKRLLEYEKRLNPKGD